MHKKSKSSVKLLVTTAMMSALATVLMLVVRFSLLPGAKFLEYDMGDIPVIISTLFIGLPHGSFVLLFVSLIQSLTVSAASSWQGFIMHFISTGCYILILKLFMRKNNSTIRLIAGVITATIGLTLIMIPLNLIFTPLYLHTTVEAVAELLIPAIIPFNLLKGIINSLITVALYKPLKEILNKSKLITE